MNRRTLAVLGLAVCLLALGVGLGLRGSWLLALLVWLLPLELLLVGLVVYGVLALIAFVWGRLHPPRSPTARR